MSVTVAKTAGFCFGVRRAVDLAEQQAKKTEKFMPMVKLFTTCTKSSGWKLGVYTAYAFEDIPDSVACSFGRTVYHGMYTRCFKQKVRNL